jgi:hypothetical protein
MPFRLAALKPQHEFGTKPHSGTGAMIMAQTLHSAGSAANALMRIVLVVGMMMAPIVAVSAAKAGASPKISGAGLVLIVSIERNQ